MSIEDWHKLHLASLRKAEKLWRTAANAWGKGDERRARGHEAVARAEQARADRMMSRMDWSDYERDVIEEEQNDG